MHAYLDPVDGYWRLRRYESHRFSSEADANSAAELALIYALEVAALELKYRHAEKAGEPALREREKNRHQKRAKA